MGSTLAGHMEERRRELLEECRRQLTVRLPGDATSVLSAYLPALYDGLIDSMKRGQNPAATGSAVLVESNQPAADIGARAQEAGLSITQVVEAIGVISSSLGEVAGRSDDSFSAEEYGIFNVCIDASIAAALERYASNSEAERDSKENERIGYLMHELRNALTSVQMAFTVLRGGHVSLNSRTGGVLERGIARLRQLVDQSLLDVSLRARPEVTLGRFSTGRHLRDVQTLAMLERGIQIVVEADESLEVCADERLLGSALGNLVQNAIKFTRDGGTVVLRARRTGGGVAFDVEDQCGGLPEGAEERMFEPFEQYRERRRGVGLGLAITREAIDLHNGSISVTNLPGKGCVFTITLPE